MKIAMIGHKRIPSREGGVEVVVEELAVRMAQRGIKVEVYNRKGHHVADKSIYDGKEKLKEYKGVRILTIPTINRKSLDALLYSFLGTIRALFGKYDVIHYHAEGSCVMLFLPHILGIKTVATIHGLDWQRAKWGGFATKYLKMGEKIAAKYADEVIVLSKNVQQYFKDTYGRDTNYIPNGVNAAKPVKPDLIKENYGLEKNSYFLFLARIVPEKGVHYLLEAFLKTDTDKKLVIAGGSSHSNGYMERIQKMAEQDERVILTGFVQGKILEELFSNCLVYVLPSDIEGMPLSLLEAMSYGCDCLVSDIDENMEVVGECGRHFEKSNVESLKRELQKIVEEDKCRVVPRQLEFSEEVRKRFDWDNIAEEHLKLYKKVKKRDER